MKFVLFGDNPDHVKDFLKVFGPKEGSVSSLDDFLLVKNLSCVDADGRVFELHDGVYVPKDIFMEENGT